MYRVQCAIIATFFILVSSPGSASKLDSTLYGKITGQKMFSSWQGVEPDKWATIWFIKRYISKNSYFKLVPPNTEIPAGSVMFDVPGADISRSKGRSMYENLVEASGIKAGELDYLIKIIHDIEVNIWDAPTHPHSTWFETMFRKLQARYNRDEVPIDCYLRFFDEVADLSKISDVNSTQYQDRLSLTTQCPGLTKSDSAFVGQIGHLEILRQIGIGKNVVFVDTREEEEFSEVRIPGAKLLRLRDVSEEAVKPYVNADLVIPYCVKDFRGFEVAKAMKLLGVKNVATLSPNGLKGWVKASLPLTRQGGLSDEDALEQLQLCSVSPFECLQSEGER